MPTSQTPEPSRAGRPGTRRGARGKSRDPATRQRLLEAATRLFSERGFRAVTVRDLSREARANLAAVNYHFGDKLGLYREVVASAIENVHGDPITDVPEGTPPEERLRHFVLNYLPRLAMPRGRSVWAQKLMRHEMMSPTPLAPWIAERVILPRIRFLADAVAELLGTHPEDPRVERCVTGVQGQCLSYLPSHFRKVAFPDHLDMTKEEVEAAARHIVAFTLAGIRGLAVGDDPETL